jgi:hypothetical protein
MMIAKDTFQSIEEVTNHHKYLSAQIEALGEIILKYFPSMDGEFYGVGACGAAAYMIMDIEKKKETGKYLLLSELKEEYEMVLRKYLERYGVKDGSDMIPCKHLILDANRFPHLQLVNLLLPPQDQVMAWKHTEPDEAGSYYCQFCAKDNKRVSQPVLCYGGRDCYELSR